MIALLIGIGTLIVSLSLGVPLPFAAGQSVSTLVECAFWMLGGELLTVVVLWLTDRASGYRSPQKPSPALQLDEVILSWCGPSILGHMLLLLSIMFIMMSANGNLLKAIVAVFLSAIAFCASLVCFWAGVRNVRADFRRSFGERTYVPTDI